MKLKDVKHIINNYFEKTSADEIIKTFEDKKCNYVRVDELTLEEKIVMYMKLSKRELVEMVIECNRILDLIR